MIQNGYEVLWESEVPTNLGRLLSSTIYGAEGKLQYRHQDPMDKLRATSHKRILTIQWKNRVVAVAVYIQREHHRHRAFYVRYVAFDASYKLKSISSRQARKSHKVKNNQVRKRIFELLQEKLSANTTAQNIVYSYIEEDNQPSIELSRSFGFEKIRTMQTLVFNRLFPKSHGSVSKIKEEQKPFVLAQLRQYYQSYNFFVEEGLFDTGTYYISANAAGVVAGLKATIVHWDIVHLPGIEGFMIQKVLPWIPVLSKRFHKDQIRFVAFEAVWYTQGYEKAVFELMETVCAESGLYMGMLWCDTKCGLGHMLVESGKLGWLHKLNKSGHAQVLARFDGYETEDKNKYKDHPVYVSAYDVT